MHALSRAGAPVFRCLASRSLPRRAMGSSAAGRRDPADNPPVRRLRELFTGDAADGWEKSWEAGVTPWDLGKPTPIIEHLVRSGTLSKGRVLVPGCGMKDVEEIGPPNCEDGSLNNVYGHETNQKEDDVKTGMEEPPSIDGEKETVELNNGSNESSEKIGMEEPPNPSTDGEKETVELNIGGKESSEKIGMEEPPSIDGEKETVELNIGDKESSEKDNAIKDDFLSEDNNGLGHTHDIAIESTEKEEKTDTCLKDTCKNERQCIIASVQEEVNATLSVPGHSKTADDIEDTADTRLGNSPTEENACENKEHANSIS